jgi:hypothetical protein
VISEVVDGFATIDFVDGSLKGAALARLMDIGGPASIQTITREGPRRKYRVPEGNAAQAGLLDVAGRARGDTGYSAALAVVGGAGARPEQPTSANTYVGQTPKEQALGGGHIATTNLAGQPEPAKRGPGRPKKTTAPEPPPST